MDLNLLKRYKNLIKTHKPKKVTNKYYLIAEEIAKLTDTKPQRWLREVKNHEFAVNRALIDLKEIQNIRKPIGLFIFLLKKYKGVDKSTS